MSVRNDGGSPSRPDFRVLTAASAELAELVGLAGVDRGLATRIGQVGSLVDWAGRQERVDHVAEAELADEIERAVAAGEGEAVLGPLLHRMLDVRRGPQAATGPEDGRPLEALPSPEAVTAYLRGRGAATDEAHQVRAILGGFSKRTLMVSAILDGAPADIVLRQVPLGRSARSLTPEYQVLTAAYAAGITVPEPLWIEPEENALGGPFFVTRRAAGATIGDVWGADEVSKELALDVARTFAQLHALPVERLTPPISPRSTPEQLAETLTWQENTLIKRGIPVEPVLGALLTWLRGHLPPAPERVSLLHGDAAFSNLLVADDRVTALLDWEASHLGDPAEELAYLRPSIEPSLAWEDFLAEYLSAGGRAPDPAALRFHEVWSHVWRHIGCLWMRQNFEMSGRYAAAVSGLLLAPRFLEAAVAAAFCQGR